MQAIILGAGKSTRMNPIGDKVTLPFYDKTLFEHQISKLYEVGIKDFVIAANEENVEMLKKNCLKISKDLKIKFQYAVQTNFSIGFQGALLAAENLVKDEVLIINSNDFVEKSLYEKIMALRENDKVDGAVCGKVVKKYFPGGYMTHDSKLFLKDTVEKPGEGNEPSELVNILIHYYKNIKDFYKYSHSVDKAYQFVLKKYSHDKKIKIIKYHGSWRAIKYPWHVLDIKDLFFKDLEKNKIDKSAIIDSSVKIKSPVVIAADVKVEEGTQLIGPLYLGKKTKVSKNSIIKNSHIAEGCKIGKELKIEDSYIRENSIINCNLNSSVLETNTNLSSDVKVESNMQDSEIKVDIKGDQIKTGRKSLGLMSGKDTVIDRKVTIPAGSKIEKFK